MRQFLDELKRFWASRREEIDARFRRTLPFADYIVDRWEKARALGFGEGTSIYDSSLVLGDVVVGEHTWIGPFTVLDGSGGGLHIGSHCAIGAGVQIYTHDTVENVLSGGVAPISHAPTHIGNNCHIAPNVIIAKGVHIGDRVVIGASSLVLTDIPSGSKAFGIPCRVVGSI